MGDGVKVTDVSITECQGCPKPIVLAANQLMALSGVEQMVPVSDAVANIHVVTWKTPEAEGLLESWAAREAFLLFCLLTNREIGLRKIPARAQKRHVGEFRRRVRQAIAEVERGLVTTPAEPRMRIDGHFPVVLAKGHDAHVPVGQEALQKRSRLHRQARPQDERSFDEGRRADRQRVRPIEFLEELETAGLFRGNRDDG